MRTPSAPPSAPGSSEGRSVGQQKVSSDRDERKQTDMSSASTGSKVQQLAATRTADDRHRFGGHHLISLQGNFNDADGLSVAVLRNKAAESAGREAATAATVETHYGKRWSRLFIRGVASTVMG